MRKAFLSILILCCFAFANYGFANLCFASEALEYFVAPYGNKEAAGTIDDPFDKLNTAIKKIKPNGSPVVINMRKGIYYMEETAVFGPEISGTFESPVTVRAYNGENVMLSGGRPVVRWEVLDNGLWRSYVPEYDFVRNMEVNGIGAVRAQTDYKLVHEGTFKDLPNYFDDGIIIDKSNVPENFTGKNCELFFQLKWYEYHIKIDRAEQNPTNADKLKLYFKQPYNAEAFWLCAGSMTTSDEFTIINDLSLLDQEGEFYFDNESKYLYYKPRQGENPNNAQTFISKKEVLLKVEGENTQNKAGNLIFEGLTFANTTWVKGEYEGFIVDQSVNFVEVANDLKTAKPAYQIIPAAVQLDMAENVVFKDNTFSNLGAVGLGLYDGVSGTVTEGNIFRDIGSSAISVGLVSHDDSAKEGKTNVAYRKPAWASSTYPHFHALNATGGSDGFWSSNSVAGGPWLTVDLQREYSICEIELVPRGDPNYDISEARKNFEIQASLDKNFSSYTVLGAQGEEDFGINNVWHCAVESTEKFRYVRFKKTTEGLGEIRELRVYTHDLGDIPEKQVCQDNIIRNNVIARAATDFVGSAAVHIFYTENLELSNNLIIDAPYTGISFGWGWQMPNTTCRDNKIIANRIEHVMQRQYDGGGIYLLGDQPNLQITGNVIRDVRFGAGGIYPDEGTSGTFSEKIQITGNIIDDSPYWLHLWSGSSENFTITGNYTTNSVYANSGVHSSMTNNKMYIRDYPPAVVQKIIDASGPLGEYASLVEQVNGLPISGPETVDDYLNYGTNLSGAAWYSRYYLAGLIQTAEWYVELVADARIDVSANATYNDFVSALTATQEVYIAAQNETVTVDDLAAARVNLRNRTLELLDSGIFEGMNETVKTIN